MQRKKWHHLFKKKFRFFSVCDFASLTHNFFDKSCLKTHMYTTECKMPLHNNKLLCFSTFVPDLGFRFLWGHRFFFTGREGRFWQVERMRNKENNWNSLKIFTNQKTNIFHGYASPSIKSGFYLHFFSRIHTQYTKMHCYEQICE